MVMTAPEADYRSYFIHLQPEGALMVDYHTMYYYRLSGIATQWALWLSRTSSLKKTADIWSSLVEYPFTVDELSAALDQHPLTQSWKSGALRNLRVTGSNSSYLPLSCTLQLTNRCNLACSFCFTRSGAPYPDELSTDQWIDVLQKLATHGVADIALTGGEARLVKGFNRILAAASSLFTSVHVFSNGLYWSETEAELAANLGNVTVQISIDGPPEIHDRLRGRKGAYSESIHCIRRLAGLGVPCVVAMTVNPDNFRGLQSVIAEVAEAGARSFRAGKTLPLGRGETGGFELTCQQYQEVCQELKSASAAWRDRLLIGEWDEDGTGCTDFSTPGFLAWFIRADGIVTACQLEEVRLGHILDEPMSVIGSPERLAYARTHAVNCSCMSKVELPQEADRPFC